MVKGKGNVNLDSCNRVKKGIVQLLHFKYKKKSFYFICEILLQTTLFFYL